MRGRKQIGLDLGSEEAAEVFERWKETMGSPRSRLDPNRAKAIDAMLAIGYTVEDLQLAIFGCSVSPFHQGQNERRTKFCDITLICRDADHVDRFIDIAEKKIAKQTAKAVEAGATATRPAPSPVPAHLLAMVKKS